MSFACYVCEKTFVARSSCNRHLSEVHNTDVYFSGATEHGNSRCLEQCGDTPCGLSFSSIKYLIEHLERVHNMSIEREVLYMKTIQDFVQWKAKIEVENKCAYVFKSGKIFSNGMTKYYGCNRSKTSYTVKPSECRKRQLKSQGSCKLEYLCISNIKIKNENGNLLVEWLKTHYGHSLDANHITPRPGKRYMNRMLKNIEPQLKTDNSQRSLEKNLGIKMTKILTYNHVESVNEILQYNITIYDDYWEVTKNDNSSSNVVQQKYAEKCCQQICTICDICNHMYSCDCNYYTKHKIMCNHIHILHSSLEAQEDSSIYCITPEPSSECDEETTLILQNSEDCSGQSIITDIQEPASACSDFEYLEENSRQSTPEETTPILESLEENSQQSIEPINPESFSEYHEEITLVLENLEEYSQESIETVDHRHNKIEEIKSLLAELQNINFESLDDFVINKIYDHLKNAYDLTQNYKLESKNQCQVQDIPVKRIKITKPQYKFIPLRKDNVEAATSLNRPGTQKLQLLLENPKVNILSDKCLVKSVIQLPDHQYC